MQRAARELNAAVLALQELIRREYPSRREVERRFLSKESQSKRWVIVLVLVVMSAMISFISTVTTVSSCFLQPPSQTAAACNLMPGFKETQRRNQQIIDNFNQLDKITKKNTNRLDELEGR